MRYTLEELNAKTTLFQGHTDNLKHETSTKRVWLSRMTVQDGQPYNNQVTHEYLIDGTWQILEQYEAN